MLAIEKKFTNYYIQTQNNKVYEPKLEKNYKIYFYIKYDWIDEKKRELVTHITR